LDIIIVSFFIENVNKVTHSKYISTCNQDQVDNHNDPFNIRKLVRGLIDAFTNGANTLIRQSDITHHHTYITLSYSGDDYYYYYMDGTYSITCYKHYSIIQKTENKKT